MTVERETTVQLAHAEMNDEYGVDFDFQGTSDALTVDEALRIAEELSEAAREAQEAAVEDARRPIAPARFDLLGQVTAIAADIGAEVIVTDRLSPDCRAGKHPHSWQDEAWDDARDVTIPCECSCHTAGAAA